MQYVLRDYQQDLDEKVKDAIRRKKKRILVRSPTGSGKTVLFASWSSRAEDKGNRTTILAPRRELIYQPVEKLKRYGVEAGMIMAGEPLHTDRKVQVASFDTVLSRAFKTEKIVLPPSRLVIADEAHLSIAPTRKKILDHYIEQGALLIGLTATPARTDGLSLGNLYDELVQGWTTRQMMDAGYLVRVRYFCPTPVDLSKLKVARGDFVDAELEAEFDKPKLVGEIVDNWLRIASTRSTVVFCITRKHARHVLETFRRANVAAEYVDGETPLLDRAAIFRRVDSGETRVLVNVFVATFGLDIPRLDCIVIARPTKSLVLYHQMGGRVLRPLWDDEYPTVTKRLEVIAASAKPDCILIDHAGVVDLHGLLDDDVPWSLADKGTVSERKLAKQKEEQALKEITCPQCKAIFKGARHCPQCGFELIPPSEPVPFYRADLKEIEQKEKQEGKRRNKVDSWEEKAEFYGQALGYARRHGYNSGWAAHAYDYRYGVMPNDPRVRNVCAREPGELIINHIKHVAMRNRFSRRN